MATACENLCSSLQNDSEIKLYDSKFYILKEEFK
jgi:hypothetical protein